MHAKYQLTRRALFWTWEADFRGQASASGRALSKGGARRAARNWIRARLAAVRSAPEANVPEPVRLAA